MISLFIFIVITFFLIRRLVEILGLHIGHKVNMEEDDFFSNSEYEESFVEEIKSAEQGIEEKIRAISTAYTRFEKSDFINKAKKVFEIVFEAYAKGDKRSLKNLLAARIYDAFAMAIDDRNSRGEILEGILVRFIKANIIDAYTSDDDIFITVEFVTEQSNVLKSADGKILEGDSDFVETRTDVWVFQRKKISPDPRWFLHEIKDQS